MILVRTRRGDLEVLGYNLLHWTTSTLPWENITDPKVVEEKKKSILSSGASSVKKTLPSTPLGEVVINNVESPTRCKPKVFVNTVYSESTALTRSLLQ